MIRDVETPWGVLRVQLTQARAMRLARMVADTFAGPALDLLGAGVAAATQIDGDLSDADALLAIGHALAQEAGRDRVEALVHTLVSDRVAQVCASVLDGCSLGGAGLVRQRPPQGWRADDPDADPHDFDRWHPLDSMTPAIVGDTDGWALHRLALIVAVEARLLPLPDGSSESEGSQDKGEAGSRSGSSAPSSGVATRQS